MKLKHRNKKLFIFVLLFFLIFSPHINFFGQNIKTAYIFVLIPGVLGFIMFAKSKIKLGNLKITYYLMIFSLIYQIFMFTIHTFIDPSFVSRMIYGFIEFFAAIYFGKEYNRLYGTTAIRKILVHLFIVGIIHSLLMIFLFISPGFRENFYEVVNLSELAFTSTFREDGFARFSGLFNVGFGALSIVNAVLYLCGLLVFLLFRGLRRDVFVFGSILILISSFLSGRVGVVITILTSVLLMILPIRSNGVTFLKIRLLIFMSPLLYFLIVITESYFPNVSNFVFETYYNYVNFGVLDKSTQLLLEEELSYEPNLFNLFFGTGNYSSGNFDGGYKVMLYGGGYIGIFVSFLFLAGLFFVRQQKSVHLDLIISMFIIVILIINFKNLYYFGYNDVFQILFLIICTSALSSVHGRKGGTTSAKVIS